MSSGHWNEFPTPSATAYGSSGNGTKHPNGPTKGRPSLETMAARNLWPTPTAQDAKNDGGPSQWERNTQPLNVAVKRWPTPTAQDAESSGSRSGNPNSKAHPGTSLTDAVRPDRQKRFPTPRAEDSQCASGHRGADDTLYGAICKPRDGSSESPGQLNPTWVEWLLGFPLEWTVCEPSATRSSRKSRSGSASS
ncbi:MAG TPA: hypothetical protein VLA89_12770 [Gemmatimonadales bacterium]|nr:hypothetical protein [Gemmatimonadales bacterium]